MICWKRYILSNFRKWSICSFFLSNGNYRFSKKIPGLLNSCLNVLTVFYTLKYSTDNFFDWCVHFAKISAIQRNWQARIFFSVYYSFFCEGYQQSFLCETTTVIWRSILRTFETIPQKCAMFEREKPSASSSLVIYSCSLIVAVFIEDEG